MEDEKLEKLVEVIAAKLEFKNEISTAFMNEALKAIIRFDEKHTEKKGLSEYKEFGPASVMFDMSKKYNSLKEEYFGGDKTPGNDKEKLWQDVSVYALIGKMVENGKW